MVTDPLRARLAALYEKYRGQGVEYASWGDDLLNDIAALLREPAPVTLDIETRAADFMVRAGRVIDLDETAYTTLSEMVYDELTDAARAASEKADA
jgi:hypothetical protein